MVETAIELERIRKELAEIHSLLQHLPELQAAVLLQMWEEAQTAKLYGKTLRDIWTTAPPDQR